MTLSAYILASDGLHPLAWGFRGPRTKRFHVVDDIREFHSLVFGFTPCSTRRTNVSGFLTEAEATNPALCPKCRAYLKAARAQNRLVVA